LNISGTRESVLGMKTLLPSMIALLATMGAAQAACYADYKAKQDDPLRLHYGVAQITGACTPAQAEAELIPRLATDGWQLLSVEGVFDDAGLEERRESAGEFYLRY
jgi:hypothetical protein